MLLLRFLLEDAKCFEIVFNLLERSQRGLAISRAAVSGASVDLTLDEFPGQMSQLGHATYVFTKPRNMDSFLVLYTKTTMSDIRKNLDNIGERLGFLARVVHPA